MSMQQAWADLVVDALACAGAQDVVISPGSRSTPFVLAAQAHGALRCRDVIDERCAAFFALGQARVTGRPTVLLCTSGTAPAHYYPAVIEASQSFVPMVVLSADRPPEQHGCGANQTVDQTWLFGGHVRHFVDLGVAEPREEVLRGARRATIRAVSAAFGPTPGPVHLNVRVRKPLEPDAGERPEALERVVEHARQEATPWVYTAGTAPDPAAVQALAEACAGFDHGVIVAGPASLGQARALDAVRTLARVTGFAVLAEGTSQLRFVGGATEEPVAFDAFDAVYRGAVARTRLRPSLVLQLGATPVSSGLERLLAEQRDVHRWVVDPYGWGDPHGRAAGFVRSDVEATVRAVVAALGDPALGERPARTAFRNVLAQADARAWAEIDRALGAGYGEGTVVRTVVDAVPDDALLSVGNSLPVRELDLWCPGRAASVPVLSQRGASGIDGSLSAAAGAASQWNGPVVLLVGDVSFLHDVGGLLAARAVRGPLVVVVVANDGGRIFEQLPIGAREDLQGAMPRFTTPHGLSAAPIARAYGLSAARTEDRDALLTELGAALGRWGCTVIEAVVPPQGAAAQQHALWEAIAASVAELQVPS